MFSGEALKKVIELKPQTLLDVGAGKCEQSKEFSKHGIKVTAIDIGNKPDILPEGIEYVQGFFENVTFLKKFDCVWSSHVLEHTLNPQLFIKQIVENCKEGGYIAITVPPMKHQIVGGHVNLFNAGIIMYRLVLAGINCSRAMIKSYGYNISVIVQKHSISEDLLSKLVFDNGDIETISKYLPEGHNYQGFNGDIKILNWS